MADALRVEPGSESDYWSDSHSAFCRLLNTAVGAGKQPAFSADGGLCLFLFGECFGYEDRKRDLMRLGWRLSAEKNDAEFALCLYEQHGEAGFGMLSGSFCLAVYDKRDFSLRLVSDRLGSRPLFYGTNRDGRLSFATRVSPLLNDDGISGELDATAVGEFCALQKVLGHKTYHRGIFMLPAGSVLHLRDGAVRLARYWVPHYQPRPGTLDQYAEELAETIRAAMANIGRGAGRVGVLLSGGLDARMIVAAAGRDLTCYCFGDYENPEFESARRVAEARGFEIRFMQRDPDHYPNILDRAVELGSGMHPFNHAHALGFVEQIAAEAPVLTHGYGIEALFRGTTLPKEERLVWGIPLGTRLDPTLNEDNLPFRYHRRAYSLLGKYPAIFAPGVADDLERRIEESAKQTIAEASPHCSNVFDKLLWSDVFARSRYTGYLFLLSMRPYVAERSVLFDNQVIDLHLQVPLELRADDRLWLRAMSILDPRVARVANANTGHRPDAPPWALAGRKRVNAVVQRLPLLWRIGRDRAAGPQGAGGSPRSWPRFDWMIRHNPRLRSMITDTLSDPEALPPSLFQADRVGALLADHLSGRGYHRELLFALLTLGWWHRKHAVRR